MISDLGCQDSLNIIIIMLWCIFMVLCFNFVVKVLYFHISLLYLCKVRKSLNSFLQIWILERVDLCHRPIPKVSGPVLVWVEKVDLDFESWKRSQAEVLTRMQKISACRIKMDGVKLGCVRN